MKKVLIITYYWPPAGGPGVQRMVRFAKYLPQFGWEPIILTVKNGDFPAIDEELVKELPDDIKVYRSHAMEPFKIFKFLSGKGKKDTLPTYVLNRGKKEDLFQKISRFIRANIFVPDARIGWIPFLIKSANKVIREEKPDIILSSSPPHSLQIAVKQIVKKHKLPWICDLRDPWTGAFWEKEMPQMNMIKNINMNLERNTLKVPDLFTTVSPALGKQFNEKCSGNFEVIYNGFENIEVSGSSEEFFNIYYFGHLSKSQSPFELYSALNRFSKKIKSHFRVIFVGKIFNEYQHWIQKNTDIKSEFINYLSKKELLQLGKDAALLLTISPEIDYANAIVGTKIFDYLSLKKRILSIGGKQGAVDDILTDMNAGKAFDKDDGDAIYDYIQRIFDGWKKNGNSQMFLSGNSKIYEAEYNVEKLAKLLDNQIA